MDCVVGDTLDYVIFLTRHVKKGNIPKAILTVLMELGFQTDYDGFGYLRKAIFLKSNDSDLRVNAIYREVGRISEQKRGIRQVENAIHNAIDAAWVVRKREKWHHFSSAGRNWGDSKPANGVFISTMACVMELWCDCEREVSYAGK